MKIVLIYGQNHKGTTYHMGRMLAEKLTTAENIKEFFLPQSLNHFCSGRCILQRRDKDNQTIPVLLGSSVHKKLFTPCPCNELEYG